MSPRRLSHDLVRDTPVLRITDSVEHAIRQLLESDLPALPVVDDQDRLRGIFGEREFMSALFPGYVSQLRHAGFVKRNLDEAIERRASCTVEPVERYLNTEHVDVDADYSDVGLAEIFLHHRVLIVPVTENRRVVGVITRTDFFQRLAERVLHHA